MNNSQQYITEADYNTWAGGSWPSYTAFISGKYQVSPEIQSELDQLLSMHVKSGKVFPIRTATSCQSKWTWSTIYLNTLSSASCHRVTPTKFDLQDFDNFHNLPKKIQDRKLMLKGEWPSGGCEYCKDIEQAGGHSDRQHNLLIPGLVPPELESDPTQVVVSPRIVEIFAQNTCNLACVYCNSNLSSKIAQENVKFGDFKLNGVRIPVESIPDTTDAYFTKFVSWLAINITSLVRLHLLGGETFIQHKLMESVLSILESTPCPELQLCVFSNLNVPDKYWDLYTGRIQDLQARGHIQVFDLTASIDCWGPASSYVRSGLNLDKFESRMSWASNQGSWLRLNINQTVTAMTIKTMPELIQKITQYSEHKHIGHYFQFYTGAHMFQHPKIYAWDFWKADFERIMSVMPTDTTEQLEAITRMTGMQQLLRAHTEHQPEEIRKLMTYLTELDRRRDTNWRNLFDYLDIFTV